MSDLTDKIRAKFPGSYDDISDADLEKSVLEKHPEYKDLAQPTEISATISSKPVDEPAPEPGIQNLGNVTADSARADIGDQTPPEEPSLLSKLWRQQTSPIANLRGSENSTIRHATDDFAKEHPIVGGGLNFLADAISGLSSPLNLETAGAFTGGELAGKAGLETIAKALTNTGRGLSVPVVGEGIKNTITGEGAATKASGVLEVLGGLWGMRGPGHLNSIADSALSHDIPPSIDMPSAEVHPELPPDMVPMGGEDTFNSSRPSQGIPQIDESKLYRIASEKQGMGLSDINKEEPLSAPTNVSPMFNGRGQKGMTGNIQNSIANDIPNKVKPEPIVSNMKEPTPELLSQARDKGPDSIVLKNATPDLVRKAGMYGYQFSEVTEDGGFRMVKSTVNDSSDLYSEATKSKGPAKSGLPYTNDKGEIIGYTTDKNGSTGMSTINPETGEEIQSSFKSQSGQPIKIDPRTQALLSKRGGNVSKPPSNIPPSNGSMPPNNGGKHVGPLIDVKKASPFVEAINFPRAIMASMDFSAPLRQGLGLIHKKEWWTSLGSMFKSWGSENAFRQIQESIAEKPLFKSFNNKPSFAEQMGLKLTDLTDLSKREEALMSTWAEKVPGVRPSNRAYTAFLNKLRADTFENLMKDSRVLGVDGEINLPLARELANFVNTATGRGSLGKLESSAVALNSILFAPRLIAARLTMLNPMYYMMANPMVRQEAIKSLLAVASVGTAIGQLSKLAGADVDNNPTSSDFGKIKVGNTRIDPFGGFQQYIVAVNKLVSGKSTSTVSGKESDLNNPQFGRQSRFDVVERFGESKLNPIVNLATTLLHGKDAAGKPLNIPEQIASRFIPMFLQDLKTVATENPNLIPYYHDLGFENTNPKRALLATPAAFGVGVQNYPSR